MLKRKNPDILHKFKASEHYKVSRDKNALNEDNLFIKPNEAGINLIADYYAWKYRTNIQICPLQTENGYSLDPIIAAITAERLNPQMKDQPKDFRKAFLLLEYFEELLLHSVPIFYIRENNKEVLLVADSINGIETARILAKATGLKTFVIPHQRQADGYSCHTDSTTMSRVITGQNAHGFLLPNLIEKLEDGCEEKDGVFFVKAPAELLITVQTESFLLLHHATLSKIAHHNSKGEDESLEAFYKRFPENMLQIDNKPASGYLRTKGINNADTIEIQFYINQLEKIFSDKWTQSLRAEFIAKAQQELAAQGTPTPETIDDREGIYKLALSFIDEKLTSSAELISNNPKRVNVNKTNS